MLARETTKKSIRRLGLACILALWGAAQVSAYPPGSTMWRQQVYRQYQANRMTMEGGARLQNTLRNYWLRRQNDGRRYYAAPQVRRPARHWGRLFQNRWRR